MVQILVILILLGVPLRGRAEEQEFDVDKFFREIKQAQTSLNYQAEQSIYAVSLPKSIVARFKVTCVYPYRKRERLDETPDKKVILLEDGKYLWTYLPSRCLVIKKPLRSEMSYFFPTNFYDDIELIKKNYQIVKRGQVPATNVICQVVEFLPNQDNSPIREIWFEQERKLPVRTYIYTRRGRLTYISELDNIQWNPQLDKDAFQLRVPPMTRVYEITEKSNLTLEEAQKLTHVPILLPPRIPPGFHPFNILVRFEGDRKKVQMVYSDGLSSFSIFQESIPSSPDTTKGKCSVPAATKPQPEGTPFISHYGLLKAFSCDLHGMRATLVGDISENDLLDTARSFSTLK